MTAAGYLDSAWPGRRRTARPGSRARVLLWQAAPESPGEPRREWAESVLAEAATVGTGQAGTMLALTWNTLPGSYSALILASRSYLAAP